MFNIKQRIKSLCICFIIILFFSQLSAYANDPLVFGYKKIMHSKILNEKREILIRLPESYSSSPNRTYPVIYTLDGNAHFKHVVGTVEWLSESANMIPEHIVVAIVNTDRFRDFSPSVPKDYQGNGKPGGAKQFTQFIANELIPHIDQQYRTQPFRTLAGHSMGGLLALHILFSSPNTFQAFISQSPHLIYDNGKLVTRVEQTLKKGANLSAFLYLSLGNEGDGRHPFDKLLSVLRKQAPKGLKWSSHIYPLETHMSTPSKTLHNALLELQVYAGWRIDNELMQKDIAAIKQHYQSLSKRFGFEIPVPEREINRMGYEALTNARHERAISIFTTNIEMFPTSINAYDSLAEAYEANGDIEKAIQLQNKAVTLAKEQSSRSLSQVERRLHYLTSIKTSR